MPHPSQGKALEIWGMEEIWSLSSVPGWDRGGVNGGTAGTLRPRKHPGEAGVR